jgi:hypothetical protein
VEERARSELGMVKPGETFYRVVEPHAAASSLRPAAAPMPLPDADAGAPAAAEQRAAMTWAVMPAAGRGSRLGGELPKQYLTIAGRPMIEHSLRALLGHPEVDGVMVALAPDDPWWAAGATWKTSRSTPASAAPSAPTRCWRRCRRCRRR